MKSKWTSIGSIIQLTFGLLAIAAFIVLTAVGEDLTRWIITALLAAAYVVMGIVGIIAYKKSANKAK